ncbi:MAG: diadenylate cyclase CdaA [bacterium]|nr:diadenylate cyclase CdaA [bacterium]
MIDALISFVHGMIRPFNWSLNWINAFQILFIAGMLLIFYRKFIKNTQSEKLVKGLFILFFAWIFSELLITVNLQIIGGFFKTLVTLIALSLIVIFQPELRRFLGYLGQLSFIKKMFLSNGSYKEEEEQDIDLIKEITEAVKYLTKTKTGALIVFKKSMNTLAYSEVGTKLDAKVSAELILTIFHPNTPLHDGALVIDGHRIHSAGVLLPLTEDPKLSWKYGTRHRAAIGLSEISDAACLVVSEETGDVSICMDGLLKKYEDLTTLKTDLESILGIKPKDANEKHKNIFDKLLGK